MLFIALDTNIIRKQNNQITNIMDFCFSNFVSNELPCLIRQFSNNVEIKIAIPEVCIEEYIRQRTEDYVSCVKKYNEVAAKLNTAYPITMPDFLCEGAYVEQLRSDALDYCKENNIVIINCMDFIDWNSMFRNSINRRLPFKNDGNSPFKDAMIYESCLGFVKNHEYDQLILLTCNSKDFNLLDSLHKQNNFKIICPNETAMLGELISGVKYFGINIDVDFATSGEMFANSDDVQIKIKEAFQLHVLTLGSFSAPLIVQNVNGNYDYTYNIDEENEQVEIIANIIDGEEEGLNAMHLFFNRDNGGYLFRQCAIIIENVNGEELLNA